MSVTETTDHIHRDELEIQSVIENFERMQLWEIPGFQLKWRAMKSDAEQTRVLLAEDNMIDQINIRRLLEKQGIEVICVNNGREAVDRFGGEQFDMILLDILMPEMDGFEAACRIREKERHGSEILILALTAYSLRAVSDKCKNVGMNGYLSKPVSANDLGKLFEMLGRNRIDQNAERGGIKANCIDGLPVMDMDGCLDNLGGDNELFLDIVTMFTENVPLIIKELISALEVGDFAKVEYQAHNLKGMSSNIGAKRIAELAHTIHTSARTARQDDLELLIIRLREEFELLMDAVRMERSKDA